MTACLIPLYELTIAIRLSSSLRAHGHYVWTRGHCSNATSSQSAQIIALRGGFFLVKSSAHTCNIPTCTHSLSLFLTYSLSLSLSLSLSHTHTHTRARARAPFCADLCPKPETYTIRLTWIEFNGGKMVQDQRTMEKNFMGLSRGSTASLHHEERECVNKSAEAARHMHMFSNHIYFADPHRSSSQYLSDVKSTSMLDAVDRHAVPARSFYGKNLTIGPSSSNYSAFAAAARLSDRSTGDGTGSQHLICFNNSQAPRLNKVSDDYQFTPHGGGLENGYVVPVLHSNSSAIESSKDQSRLKLKMFPFMAPALHEPGLRTMTGQQVVVTGSSLCAPRTTFPSSSRPVMASESPTKTNNGQLTIFYKGQVNVYNNVLPAKVQDIMLMAAAHNSSPEPLEFSSKTSDSHVNVECEKLLHIDLNIRSQPDESKANRAGANLTPIRMRMLQEDEADSSIAGRNNNFVEEEPPVPQALPQARKASLARFLERRRERLMARSPYSVERCSN